MRRLTPPELLPWTGTPLPSPEDILLALQALPGWSLDTRTMPHCLTRLWHTRDFADSLALLNAVAALAETAGHHPDIRLGWGYLSVSWTTHDQGGVHANDLRLAAATSHALERATD